MTNELDCPNCNNEIKINQNELLNKTDNLIKRFNKIDFNKKLEYLKIEAERKTEELEEEIKEKENQINEIQRNIRKYERKYKFISITEDEQFERLGIIYKKDYDLYRKGLDLDRELADHVEDIESMEQQITLLEKKLFDLEVEEPPFNVLYLELMKHTGVIIKEDSAFVLDKKNLRIVELNNENKELIWELIEYKNNDK